VTNGISCEVTVFSLRITSMSHIEQKNQYLILISYQQAMVRVEHHSQCTDRYLKVLSLMLVLALVLVQAN